MALNLYDSGDDDYIDMEISSNSIIFRNSITPFHPREFEFQMSSNSVHKESSTSPADELFYKGNLLPLHLPPRLQMVRSILEKSNSVFEDRIEACDEFFSTPLISMTPTAVNTPFESCNVSPSGSCRISRELVLDYSTNVTDLPKKSLTKKIKGSSFGSKIKASSAYIKSFFGKSGCSDKSYAGANAKIVDRVSASTVNNKNPFGQIKRCEIFQRSNFVTENGPGNHRRSFSVSMKRHSNNKCSSFNSGYSSSSSSSSSSSRGTHDIRLLKRSNSSNSEMESSIKGAIAHCKQCQ